MYCLIMVINLKLEKLLDELELNVATNEGFLHYLPLLAESMSYTTLFGGALLGAYLSTTIYTSIK